MRAAGFYVVRLVAILIVFVGGVALVPRVAVAGEIEIALHTTGLDEAAEEAFRTALRRAFVGTRHKVVPPGKPTHTLDVKLKKKGSVYDFGLAIKTASSENVLGARSGRCGPCTLDEATNKLKLATESLEVEAFENEAVASTPKEAEPTGRAAASAASLLPAASGATPGEAPEKSVADSTRETAIAATTSGGKKELSRWYTAMVWTGFTTGIGSLTAVFHASKDDYRCRAPDVSDEGICSPPALGLAVLSATGGAVAVGSSVGLLLFPPTSADLDANLAGRTGYVRWLYLAAGALNVASGVELIRQDGYGDDRVRTAGIATVASGVVGMASALGALAVGVRGVEGPSVHAWFVPGKIGFAGTF